MGSKTRDVSDLISVPSGGGAIKGLGETFSPDLHTGTSNFSIPLALPAGRNGFQPKLSLGYSSGNGNGPFGLGWAIDVPGITRKTSTGIPRYLDDSLLGRPDTFILSGAEDLVATEQLDHVQRYRPRTEGLFARIEHHGEAATDHWEVRSKDGLVSFYGSPQAGDSKACTLADPRDSRKIFQWRLSQTKDPFGNVIWYEYEKDAGEDVDRIWDQIYLSRLAYVDFARKTSTDTEFLFTAQFFYEDRPDSFSDYRAGFEVRTRRRCSHIEIHSHADGDQLVRRYRLIYLDQTHIPIEDLPPNRVSLLAQIVVDGADGQQALPPLQFNYSSFQSNKRRYQAFESAGSSAPGLSLANPNVDLVGLFGNGLPDLVQMDGVVRYWRNLGSGRFDVLRTMQKTPPGVRLSDAGVQLLDANGNGKADLVVTNGGLGGYYPLTFSGNWNPTGFVRYPQTPAVDLDSPDVRLLDLDGDGLTDALRTAGTFEFYYNDRTLGWYKIETRPRIADDAFPNVSFRDPRVKLGDLTGDGLQDIALVHNGRFEYWPYKGYGLWGKRVVMANSPRFDDATLYPDVGFDPKRLLLGDVDGDGLADLVYAASGHVTVWFNQGGNAWSDPITIHGTPPVTDQASVRLADMLGTGTEGILWTYDFGTFTDSTYKFLDLTGGVKPYLLTDIDNGLGAVTKVIYAPSTQFYLEDQADPQRRWRTPLPFPVHVVARVESIDQISQGKLTTEYRYHHGYWDGIEREFRGFGMVEQLDTQVFEDFHLSGSREFAGVSEHHFSPPTLTKTWFHAGAVDREDGDWQELDWSDSYWPGDPQALGHDEGINGFLQTLIDPQAKRDALRAMRGSVLRSELYALDGSPLADRPYTIVEHAYGLREESPPAPGEEDRRHIFFALPMAQRTTQWERGDEPMTQFAFTDDYDAYGQPRRQTSIAVPRGRDYREDVANADPYLATLSLTKYAQRDDADHYLIDRVARNESFEIVNDGHTNVLALHQNIQSGTAERCRFSQSFSYYDGEAFVGLPVGDLGDFGALVRTETLVLTNDILGRAYADAPGIPLIFGSDPVSWTDEYPREYRTLTSDRAGYDYANGDDHRTQGFFVQTSRVAYDFQPGHQPPQIVPRGLPLVYRDALGKDATIGYDDYGLLPLNVTDAAGLVTSATHDYRFLQPREVVDQNSNRTRIEFSPLGLVDAVFVVGKPDANEGDARQPGSRFVYDFFEFSQRAQPISVRAIRREHHDTEADVTDEDRDATIETVQYSDGFGRIIQTRMQAENVLFDEAVLPIDQGDANGTRATVIGRARATDAAPNVVVSGWQTYDNKGRVVEKYEPFYSVGWVYAEPLDSERGQKVKMFYDPRGQTIRTVDPDGSEQRVIYGIPDDLKTPDGFKPAAWEAYTYDANDNAGRTHPDKSQAYSYHWDTPSNVVVDALGRTVLAVARNCDAPNAAVEEFRTQSTYDIRGNLLTLTDALGRRAFTYVYDLANQPLRTESIDAGVRTVTLNAIGAEIERCDSKGALILQAYDALHRPVRFWARDDSALPLTLRQRIEYGDSGSPAQPAADREAARARNLLGKPVRHYDEAGLTTLDSIDFKGNVLEKSRRVIADAPMLAAYADGAANGWKITPFQVDWQPGPQQSQADHEAELLETNSFQTSARYDALNRVQLMQFPRDVEGARRELRPEYNHAGGLEKVWLDDALYVERIAYDAKGQRALITYGNGVMTHYAYDPQTFRLKRLRSERYIKTDDISYAPAGEALQDYGYDYDLAGNILAISDRAPGSGIINNPDAFSVGDPSLAQSLVSGNALNRSFEYDAIYRLLSGTGRECDVPPDGPPWLDVPRCTDLTRTRAYTERYRYDAMGNMLRLAHRNGTEGFTREFTVEAANNRLKQLRVGDNPYNYSYDDNGNMTAETTSRHFEWNHSDQMKVFRIQTDGAESSVYAHYLYDASGQRVKKLVRKQGGQIEVTHYIDEVFEHHRWGGQSQAGENNHVHVMDDKQRIALVRLGPAHPDDQTPAVQFQLGDHLGSSNVVVNSDGVLINREEFTPYGETSFGSFAKKGYRFTGIEREEESGLNYGIARYYAAWIARWGNTDPKGLPSGMNGFSYSNGNPVRYIDPKGLAPEDSDNFFPTDRLINPDDPQAFPTTRSTALVLDNGDITAKDEPAPEAATELQTWDNSLVSRPSKNETEEWLEAIYLNNKRPFITEKDVLSRTAARPEGVRSTTAFPLEQSVLFGVTLVGTWSTAQVSKLIATSLAKQLTGGATRLSALYLPKAGWDLGLAIAQALDDEEEARYDAAVKASTNVILLSLDLIRQNMQACELNSRGRAEVAAVLKPWQAKFEWKMTSWVLDDLKRYPFDDQGRHFLAQSVADLANTLIGVYRNSQNRQ